MLPEQLDGTCLAARPAEAYDPPSADDALTDEPTAPPVPVPDPVLVSNPILVPDPILVSNPVRDDGGASTFSPVTMQFTCRAAGMACTVACSYCGTIKQVTSGMATEFPDRSTAVFIAERGTDDWPDDPSRMILVDSNGSAANAVSCDEGCACAAVDDDI